MCIDGALPHKMTPFMSSLFPRFPSTSPLKPIPRSAPASASGSIKKRTSFRDKEGFFRFRSIKKQEKETQVSEVGHRLLYLCYVQLLI